MERHVQRCCRSVCSLSLPSMKHLWLLFLCLLHSGLSEEVHYCASHERGSCSSFTDEAALLQKEMSLHETLKPSFVDEALEALERADVNKDGSLAQKEARGFMKNTMIERMLDKESKQTLAKVLVEASGTSKTGAFEVDGAVTDELTFYAERLFASLNADADGSITPAEADAYSRKMSWGKALVPTDRQELFSAQFDINRNGALEKDEVLASASRFLTTWLHAASQAKFQKYTGPTAYFLYSGERALCLQGPPDYVSKALERFKSSPLRTAFASVQVADGKCSDQGYTQGGSPTPCFPEAFIFHNGAPSTLGHVEWEKQLQAEYVQQLHATQEDVNQGMVDMCLKIQQ
eukprot:gnl/TRDRNA2_/TRDRNA2_186299_c0_seq1.p1 gnl/TRDRNA2_/TRDRNA2_186299_c0~~gnl/TRDRNA2_/TRDRNA2_186299_c0_seq1.p1  ORF type:complete len:348 (+),score=70.96 gnl/TRDRNA2_/TRDRNA2_186299_c0_seq1:81-1124(+)